MDGQVTRRRLDQDCLEQTQKRIHVFDSSKCHRSETVKEILHNSHWTRRVIIPGRVTAILSTSGRASEQTNELILQECWNNWYGGDQHTFIAKGRMRKPELQNIFQCIMDAWSELDPQIVVHAFKKCCLSNSMDSTEDDIVQEHYIKPKETTRMPHLLKKDNCLLSKNVPGKSPYCPREIISPKESACCQQTVCHINSVYWYFGATKQTQKTAMYYTEEQEFCRLFWHKKSVHTKRECLLYPKYHIHQQLMATLKLGGLPSVARSPTDLQQTLLFSGDHQVTVWQLLPNWQMMDRQLPDFLLMVKELKIGD